MESNDAVVEMFRTAMELELNGFTFDEIAQAAQEVSEEYRTNYPTDD